MTKHHPLNERIKKTYFTYLKEAQRRDEASIDDVAKALSRSSFEGRVPGHDLGRRDHPRQAHLATDLQGALAAAIIRLRNDPGLRRTLGAAACECAVFDPGCRCPTGGVVSRWRSVQAGIGPLSVGKPNR